MGEVITSGRFDYRVPALPGWVQGRPSGDPSMTFWLRFRGGRAPDTRALVSIVDAAWPAVMELALLPAS